MKSSFDEVVIAAWLHDIGKFAEIASISELAKDAEKAANKHTVYNRNFLSKHKDVLPNGVDFENILNLASSYCDDNSFEAQLILASDGLASGRSKRDGAHFDGKPRQMQHLLSTIQIDGKEKPKTAYCKIAPLENENVIPACEIKNPLGDYKKLWNEFEADFSKLKGLETVQFLVSLSSLFERYFWCVPSGSENDASLFQHAKMSAAFAGALYRFHESSKTENEADLWNEETKKFHFINGDVSGIQKYIFDLKTTAYNAKLLRAKSFELWALSEVISQYICNQFDVSYANIITSAGGKFLVLVPEIENIETSMTNLQLDIEEYFLSEFTGHLAVIISDGVSASASDLKKENAQKLFNKIGEDSDRCKQKKMQKALQKNGQVLEDYYDKLARFGECRQCGIFPLEMSTNEDDAKCSNCENLIDIGSSLVRDPSLVKLDSKKLRPFSELVKVQQRDKGFGYTVNEFEAGKPVMYLPYVAPWDEKQRQIKTFEEIAEEANGAKKLAMFKADIDNLGFIFSSSLGERFSFSGYADLSHFLHYFFSAYYAHFVDNGCGGKYKDKIYTVFSGGDDLCVMGAWNDVLHFASDFQKDLCRFTNENPSVNISGGITLVSSNVPVRNIANEAEEQLEKSKSRKDASCHVLKNAVTVFGTTVSWSDYERCLKDGEWLEKMLDNNELSTGVVYRMIDFANRAEKIDSGDISDLLKMRSGIWKSNMSYIAIRNIKDAAVREKFLELGANDEAIKKSRIAVSYALYANRTN